MAIRLAWPSQWLMSATWTDFHMSRSTAPSAPRAAVIRSGTATMVTSSAMASPPIPVRAASPPAKSLSRTGTGDIGGGSTEYVPAAGNVPLAAVFTLIVTVGDSAVIVSTNRSPRVRVTSS